MMCRICEQSTHIVAFHGGSSGGLQSYLLSDNSFHSFGF